MNVRHTLLAGIALFGAAAFSSTANAIPMRCEGGSMNIAGSAATVLTIAFQPIPSNAVPGRGQCAVDGLRVGVLDLPAPQSVILPPMANAGLVAEAARDGGSFVLEVAVQPGQAVASGVLTVNVMGGMIGNGQDNAKVEDNDDAGDIGDIGEVEDMDEVDAPVFSMKAVVSIPEPDLIELNIRKKPGGKVIGTVPEGENVTLAAPCGPNKAAGFAANKGKKASSEWCEIKAPQKGFVMAKYLKFGGGNAGLVAHKKRKN